MPTISQILTASSLPRLETELLLGFVLKKGREYILTHPETTVSQKAIQQFKKLEKKRHNNWPLPYLTGNQEFYGLNFKVSPAVLIPRPETELIPDFLKADLIKLPENSRPYLLDVGTGSGAIIISATKEISKLPQLFKRTNFLGLDISAPALEIARLNAHQHQLGKKIKFLQNNLLNKIPTKKFKGRDLFISANLPYLTPKQIKGQSSIAREPRLALDGGADGLDYYRRLFKQLAILPLRSLLLICEIDPGQTVRITKLAKILIPDSQQEIKKDLRQKNRFLIIKKTAR